MRIRLSSRLLAVPVIHMSSRAHVSIASAASITPRVLSIQSHTVHGYVGNKAATFPLQCLGYDVDAINSISLSNHPDYAGGCKGKSLNPEDILAIIDGLDANSLLKYDLIITGYTRSVEIAVETATAVKKVLLANPQAIYILDPVLGDDGRFYVPSELTDFFKLNLLPLAEIITPNHFEAEALSGMKITCFASAQAACNVLHSMGPKICIMKGLQFADSVTDKSGQRHLSVVLSVKAEDGPGKVLRIDVPKIEGKFSGCGDLFTAMCGGLLCSFASSREFKGAHTWSTAELGVMLERTLEVMSKVVQSTKLAEGRELRIVESMSAYLDAKKCLKLVRKNQEIDDVKSSTVFPSAYIATGEVVGIIFDMDGTLSMPGAINYDLMYSRTGLTREGGDIITQINNNKDIAQRIEQSRIIVEEEMLACERVICRPDLTALLNSLHDSRIRVAISTKNCEKAVHRFLEIADVPLGRFDPLVTRDCLGGLSKPDPRVAQHILQGWSAAPETVWFVGDSIDDMVCGKLAGCKTCLILTDENKAVALQTEYIDVIVNSLHEFGLLIKPN